MVTIRGVSCAALSLTVGCGFGASLKKYGSSYLHTVVALGALIAVSNRSPDPMKTLTLFGTSTIGTYIVLQGKDLVDSVRQGIQSMRKTAGYIASFLPFSKE